MLTKPRSAPSASNTSMYAPGRRRRVSPLMIIGISVPVLLVLIGAGVVVALPKLFSHAAAVPAVPNPNCTLIVPAKPLTAAGLATPYQLFAADAAANGPCNEANANQGAFVQADIFDPATGQITTYAPLVIDKGTTPAAPTVTPTLPANAVVGLWFGFNGTNLTLQGTNANTLKNAKCVNGLAGSIFGQFSYCNAPAFFAGAKKAIAAGQLVVPPLGTSGVDNMACPTTRNFSVIDQDQSDNVQTQYLANGNGQTAQVNAANTAALAGATTLGNPSDNALITKFIDPALGCTAWMIPDLTNNNTPVSTLGTDELQAAAFQQAPIALVPLNDPMTLNNNNASVRKTNLYRAGSDQPPINAKDAATNGSGTTYCTNFVAGLARMQLDKTVTVNATSPAPAMANSLFSFLIMRAQQSYVNLGCQALLNAPNPVTLTMDGNGVVTGGTITLPAAAGAGTGTTGTTTPVAQTATGSLTVALNADAGNADATFTINYPGHANSPINVSVVDTATGKNIFMQNLNTGGDNTATLDTAFNGLQGLTAIPATWVYQILDPNLNNAVVGSAPVVANGLNATATIVAAAAAPAAAAPAAAAPAVAAPAAAGQVTPANAPYNKVAKNKHHMW